MACGAPHRTSAFVGRSRCACCLTTVQAPEIAAELFVSVNTIRTHMRHLYAKLGVHTRAKAVERGRELGLLAPSSRKA